MVVQLFTNIHMRTTEFVQLWKKTVHFGTNTIVNETKSQGQCTKDVQLFNGCTAFQNYTYQDHRICTGLEKNVHYGTNSIVNEIKSQGQCTKDVHMCSFFLWLYRFFLLVVQLFKNIHMRMAEFVLL